MKVKHCTTFKIIVIYILTINKVYKKLHFITYLNSLFFKSPPYPHMRVISYGLGDIGNVVYKFM